MRDKYLNLDLNLLPVLLSLRDTCSATQTAKQLSVPQSTISRLLARLRDHFDDPLFVRSGNGLSATPLACQLATQLTPLLAALANIINAQQTQDRFSRFDLNLLRLLVILSHEHNLTRAAKRLFLSQPAASRALGRLRQQLDEPLFMKTSKGFQPTSLAQRLSLRIAPLLNGIANVVNQGVAFDPEQQQGLLHLAMHPGVLGSLGHRLYNAMAQQAPGLGLHIESWGDSVPALMQSGELLGAINFEHITLPGDIARLALCELNTTRVYLRQGHPLLSQAVNGQLQPEQLIGYPLGLIYNASMHSQYQLYEMERELGLEPQSLTIRLLTDHSWMILQQLPESDLLYLSLMDHRDESGICHLSLNSPQQPVRLQLFTHARNRQHPQLLWVFRLLCGLLQIEH